MFHFVGTPCHYSRLGPEHTDGPDPQQWGRGRAQRVGDSSLEDTGLMEHPCESHHAVGPVGGRLPGTGRGVVLSRNILITHRTADSPSQTDRERHVASQ